MPKLESFNRDKPIYEMFQPVFPVLVQLIFLFIVKYCRLHPQLYPSTTQTFMKMTLSFYTRWKINMLNTKNGGLEDDFPFQWGEFF